MDAQIDHAAGRKGAVMPYNLKLAILAGLFVLVLAFVLPKLFEPNIPAD